MSPGNNESCSGAKAHAHVLALDPYVPGLQPRGSGWIKLNTNELPYPPPPAVCQAIQAEVARLARYPDPRSGALRAKLAETNRLEETQVIIGNGSDDILNLLVRCFGGPGRRTVQTAPSYSLYPVLNAIAGSGIQTLFFDETFRLPVDELVRVHPDLLFLTSPNAPTGVQFPLSEIDSLAGRMSGLLVIDEAYVDFAGETARPLLDSHANVVITRTFSKAYGLAGLRVGYALAQSDVIAVLDRVRDSYNVNRLSQAGALAALSEGAVYADYIERIKQTRETVRNQLETRHWKVYPSEANFLFARPTLADGRYGPEIARAFFDHLEARKILVRAFPAHPLTASFLRISIGNESEMDTFLKEAVEWTKSV